jgi:xanthine dehydrogenase accessory factor
LPLFQRFYVAFSIIARKEKKLQLILNQLISTLEGEQSAVLCSIVRNFGSAPRTSGAAMLVFGDGSIAGSVGGGALEGACQAKAHELFLGSSDFAELNYNLNAQTAASCGMACGGSASVLLHRITPDLLPALRNLQAQYIAGKKPFLLTYLPKGGAPPRLLFMGAEDGEVPFDLRSEVLRKSRRSPFLLEYQGREVFVEPLVQPGRVYLAGAGHVALATSKIASFVGFQVVVIDDRREFADTTRFPEALEVRVVDSFAHCLPALGPDDYVIIVTRGHLHDREVLAQALRTAAGYIGMIGSRKKRGAVYDSLRNEGFSETELTRVHCPIGLAIDADTPEEIAISIIAELVQVRAGRKR